MKYGNVIVIALMLLIVAGRARADGSFGRTNLTGTVAADIENYIKGGVFYGNGDGNADSITVYLEVQLNSASVRCAIYERTAGASWQLIDSSAEKSCPVGSAWHNFPLIEKVSLTEGTQYALLAWAKQSQFWNCRIRNLESQGEIADSIFFKDATYGAWPTPTAPLIIWHFDAVIVCYYSELTEPDHRPASIDEIVHRGAYIK